jgi:hypothetical protein
METAKTDLLKEQQQSAGSAQIDMYLEINVNKATEMLLSNDGLTEINGISLEATTSNHAVIELQSKTDDTRHRVEIRLCHRNLPVARCSCAKGSEHIRCGHLVEAFHAFAILGKLGFAEKLTEKSPHLWMPYDWQKT